MLLYILSILLHYINPTVIQNIFLIKFAKQTLSFTLFLRPFLLCTQTFSFIVIFLLQCMTQSVTACHIYLLATKESTCIILFLEFSIVCCFNIPHICPLICKQCILCSSYAAIYLSLSLSIHLCVIFQFMFAYLSNHKWLSALNIFLSTFDLSVHIMQFILVC